MKPSARGSRRPLWLGLAGACAVAAVVAGAIVLNQNAVPPEAAPSVGSTQPAGPARPAFDIVRVGPQGGAVIAGRAAPGAEVTIQDAGKEIGRTQADAHGSWVFTSDKPLPPGPQALTLSERNPDGQEIKGAGTVFLAVPDRVASEKPGSTVAVLTDPNAPPRMLQAEANRLGLGAVDYDSSGALRFAGSAPSGALVRVYVDNKPVGEVVGDTSGHWTLSPETAVSVGLHRLRLDQLGQADQVTARVELPFTREPPRMAVAEGNIIVQPGQNLWRMARHAYGAGIRYTVIYEANKSEIRDPNLIYPGQSFAVPGGATPATPFSSSKSR